MGIIDNIVSELGSQILGTETSNISGKRQNSLDPNRILKGLFGNEADFAGLPPSNIKQVSENDNTSFNLDEIVDKLDKGGFGSILQFWIGNGQMTLYLPMIFHRYFPEPS